VARTGDRILDEALGQFGTRGYEATSLDAIAAALGVRKQTVLYWYPSKQALLDAAMARGAEELHLALDAALSGAGPGLDRVDVRRPELLGMLREVTRLGDAAAIDLGGRLQPLLDRAASFLADEMQAGTIRQADTRLILLFVYSAVLGVATDIGAQRALDIPRGVASLARLRRELFSFVRAGLAPSPVPEVSRALGHSVATRRE
jgi:TetR/AcrR family transcriptional regulator